MKKTKYYLDTQFHEYNKPVKFLGITRKEIPTIDLISIALVDSSGREYYAIHKDCDIETMWNDTHLRTNVLPSIYNYMLSQESDYGKTFHSDLMKFDLKGMKNLLRWRGRTRLEIANEICEFIYGKEEDLVGDYMSAVQIAREYEISDKTKEPLFYSYGASYHWVIFCRIFDKITELPKGFPTYCRDLKQTLDETAENYSDKFISASETLEKKIAYIKEKANYPIEPIKFIRRPDPRQNAVWNRNLDLFLQEINRKTEEVVQ